MHLVDFGQRIKRYRNGEKVDPLVKIAKKRERGAGEYLTNVAGNS